MGDFQDFLQDLSFCLLRTYAFTTENTETELEAEGKIRKENLKFEIFSFWILVCNVDVLVKSRHSGGNRSPENF